MCRGPNAPLASQVLGARGPLGYVVTDVNGPVDEDALRVIRDLPETIRVRVLR